MSKTTSNMAKQQLEQAEALREEMVQAEQRYPEIMGGNVAKALEGVVNALDSKIEALADVQPDQHDHDEMAF